MTFHHATLHEARAALDTIERGRLTVVAEIDLPRWYWAGLALGWIGLGFVADLGYGWVTVAATFAFGTVHAAVARRVLSGRHRTPQLSVSADVAGRQAPRLVIGGLIALTGLTVAGALAANAHGTGHPVTVASIVVAVMIVLGGPQLLAIVRRKAAQPPSPHDPGPLRRAHPREHAPADRGAARGRRLGPVRVHRRPGAYRCARRCVPSDRAEWT